eukprot:625403-Prymnesium_polylepis.1
MERTYCLSGFPRSADHWAVAGADVVRGDRSKARSRSLLRAAASSDMLELRFGLWGIGASVTAGSRPQFGSER